uniref:Uncharacterized protein n=1 Tax=Arundo donax TaxID=35708 RepID=A0A0A9EHP7_ARUDO
MVRESWMNCNLDLAEFVVLVQWRITLHSIRVPFGQI